MEHLLIRGLGVQVPRGAPVLISAFALLWWKRWVVFRMTVVPAWWPLASQRSAHAVSGHPGPLGDEVRVAPQSQRDVRVAEERHHQKTSPGVLPSAIRFYASKTANRR